VRKLLKPVDPPDLAVEIIKALPKSNAAQAIQR
jgi:hypothetical protein